MVDDIWYTDLPDEGERRAILEIHLRRRGLVASEILPDAAAWDRIMAATASFVGAELEAIVTQARLEALETRNTDVPSCDELVAAANSVNPVAKLDEANIQEIRTFCQQKARPVSRVVTVADLPAAPAGRRIRNRAT